MRNKITPGPWYWNTDEGWLVADDPTDEDGGFIILAPDLDNAKIEYDPDDPDYALIANAWTLPILEARVTRLEGALRQIANYPALSMLPPIDALDDMRQIARQALDKI